MIKIFQNFAKPSLKITCA